MLKSLKEEANMTLTENGASTYITTDSDCLDLFSTIGGLRMESETKIIQRFIRAYTEDRDLAMKTLFFARDIRGGLGERRVFRIILNWLAKNEPQSVRKNLKHVAEYGRFDDLLCLIDTECEKDMVDLIRSQLNADLDALRNGGEVSLLGKWLPSINATNGETIYLAKRMAGNLGMSYSGYRKTLSALRAHIKIIENNLRERDYTFDYSKIPSKALMKYRKAFIENDSKRYDEFNAKALSGEVTLHADTLAPYELVEPYLDADHWYDNGFCSMRTLSVEEKNALNATWASLPHYGNDENALAIIDTSGSMYNKIKPLPAAVALSLGLYFAEHNTGAYKNCFIEFSNEPELIEIKGNTFADKLRYVSSFNKIANTNLMAVFDLILNTAIKRNLPASELPKKLIIISDMQFDRCVLGANPTNFENAKESFNANGYELPEIIFWNVAIRGYNQPVTKDENGVALISGCTPQIFEMIAGKIINPYQTMLDILGSERYAVIAA